MTADDFVLSSKESKTPSFIKNKKYTRTYLKDLYEMDTYSYHADEIFLSDMYEDNKTSKQGNDYKSSSCTLTLYNDDSETQVKHYIENFERFENDFTGKRLTIRQRDNNPLFYITKHVSEDGSGGYIPKSEYTVDWDLFRKNVNTLKNLDFKIYQYYVKDYENYGLKL